ncbi:MAG: protein-L-isoaspartate(D-aspartate) O-methyltransferase [Betaproteobacteria bacterium]|jgi:protein-L-isoaspartate(D-aspartate) O-methyltransferase|nr:protein-L-isoaspartate(D-aspartate) O-methyltransferase [Betaproteobacteria bacterium]
MMRHALGTGMTSERTRGRMVTRLRHQGVTDEAVLSAMAAVPRHLFVDEGLSSRAYEDSALPIGFGQTISAPFTVARMLELVGAGDPRVRKVLEVGTGCGYQAVVLAHLVAEVYSVERVGALLEKTRARLWPMRIRNLRLKHTDGFQGLPEAAPFDAIVVAAAAPRIPPALVEQLAPEGKMIIPVGQRVQHLMLVRRVGQEIIEEKLDTANFVPLLADLG